MEHPSPDLGVRDPPSSQGLWMNKDLYRLIYNRALRLWQVASELAVPRGSAAGTSPQLARRQTAQVRAVSFGLW
ncbi:hypothetical protein FUT69_03665, partial [Xylella taiwanensis]|nr:hypothetical protein [Xylella taiwanensis]